MTRKSLSRRLGGLAVGLFLTALQRRKFSMRGLALLPSMLFALAACAPQPPLTPAAAAPPPAPPNPPAMAANSPGLGPSKNMRLNYDGTYAGVSVVNNSAGNTWTSGGSQPCVAEPAPTMTISHGQARFPWQGLHAHRKRDPERSFDDDLQLWPGVRRVNQ